MSGKKYKIGAAVTLDGEREYKQALGEINAGLKVNYAEMQKTAAEYERTDDAQTALIAKTKALDGAISAQTEKVRTLESALQSSITKNGEGSKATLEWRASLTKAETELVKMNNQMGSYKDQMSKANEGTNALVGSVRSLAEGFGLQLPPAADAVINRLEGINVPAAALLGVIGGIILKLGDMTIEMSKTADEILTMSSTTGIGTDALQGFMYASELVDVSVDTMAQTLTKMTKTMGDAASGTDKQAEAYKKLNVSVTDGSGKLRDAQTVYLEVIDALGKIGNETERDYLAMQVFGKTAKELNPLIEAGTEKLAGLIEEAARLGYVLDNETLESFGALDDGMQKWDLQIQVLHMRLAEIFLPVLLKITEALNKLSPETLTVVTVLGALALVVGLASAAYNTFSTSRQIMAVVKIIEAGANATLATSEGGLAAANGMLAGSNMMLGMSFSQLLPIIALVILGIGAIILLVMGLTGSFGKMGQNADQAMDAANSLQGAQGSFSKMNIAAVPKYARGTRYHPGGPAMINDDMFGANGEIVDLPTGSRVYPAGQQPVGDTIILNVNMDEVDEISKLLQVINEAKSRRRRGFV